MTSLRRTDDVLNALALCALHHVLLDLGAVGITSDRRITVSSLYVASIDAGRTVDSLVGRQLLTPRPRQPVVDIVHITWHQLQVFKGHGARGTAA
jgi:putative restriction endonuclease